ncbi:hypothetical protein IVB38_15755 [Bradyrhizobium sp. 38]|uniref:hypothetical protein n=1 Tax=unclassified Bradyrhizobium TaxID=2631580 RepID=UPI001FFAE992|nr:MULTISPECIES: hypothetical protein [unclassified Bradyrhizobium]MCK1337441.1 hypothetical protein [Bradyrhizobium sp. 38]MCK1779788.1 hypothetical protein [Bradyrhizobium sp. 132]
MTSFRTGLFAIATAAVIVCTGGSVSTATAGAYDWMSNKPYVACVQRAHSNGQVITQLYGHTAGVIAYNRDRRTCNRQNGYPDA